MELKDSVRTIAGIGPKREAALEARGIRTVGDLLNTYPSRYIDRSIMGTLEEPTDSAVTIMAAVKNKGTLRRIRRNLSLFVLSIEQLLDDGTVLRGEVTFFNQPWLRNAFDADSTYYFYGKIVHKNGRKVIYNPQYTKAENPGTFFELTPVYPSTGALSGEIIRKQIGAIFDAGVAVPDQMPEKLRQEKNLLPLGAAMKGLHQPEKAEEVREGQRRLKFEEALKINLGILNNRGTGGLSNRSIGHFDELKRFEQHLPFTLTSGQIGVLSDIIADLKSGKVMNRLVQGDVGSGKTIIAVACAFLMAMNGYQCAYMAPTEILAEQHARNFSRMLEPFDIQVVLVTGAMKLAEHAKIAKQTASGEAQVVIGTHALFQKDMDYYNLGMVITDEQHRFGVRQRGMLAMKGKQPHTLVMSATPIPRTLALVFYGDLDISTIDCLPSGRKRIKTYFYTEKAMKKILGLMAKEMAAGYQCFMVCPFIEESEEMAEVRDTQSVFEAVKGFYKGLFKVACLHSKMKPEQKKKIIEAFNAGQIDCLVATSIIEVGIDVPRVSVITIMSADRFGLSQLHQLRGRAGRGERQSYCFLVSNATNDKTIERMRVIVNNHDGRVIAEEDYKLRGPGDYFGFRQHGFPELSALDPYEDGPLIAETREVAKRLMDSSTAGDMTYRTALMDAFYHGVEAISMN
ncbi:MAG: ATP-dependent DNA helicase RecG [Eubacteriaceae bacterium]|nr:ATP-dependent DNA helicase RecG [Eubacteriaceae bacterium]